MAFTRTTGSVRGWGPPIITRTLTAVANSDFLNLGGYRELRIDYELTPSASDQVALRTTTDGATFDATSGSYVHTGSGVSTSITLSAAAQTTMQVGSGFFREFGVLARTGYTFPSIGSVGSTAPGEREGKRATAETNTGFRIFCIGGATLTGIVRVWAIP